MIEQPEPKIFIDDVDKWNGDYYNPEINEIHVLKGEWKQYLALVHERAHAQRRNCLTFKLSKLVVIPQVALILAALLMILAVFSLAFNNIYPMLGYGLTFFFLLTCNLWEEYKANEIMQYELSLMKKATEAKTPK